MSGDAAAGRARPGGPFPRARGGAAGHRARALGLTFSVAARGLREDPLLFAVQVSRRLPGGVRTLAARALALTPGPVGRALAAWWQDRPGAVVAVLSGVGRPSRLAGELAVQVGRPDLLPQVCPRPTPALRARAAHAVGDLSGAVAVAPRALAERYAGERAVLRGEARPVVRPVVQPAVRPAGRATASGGEGVRVVHLLTNSLPHTQSGYALRSHAVLRAQAEAGLRPTAVTRLAYPAAVGRLGARVVDVVDGVEYHRMVPATLPRTLPGRLQRQAEMLDALVAARRPALLHTTTDFTNALTVRAVAETRGLPWVYEVRGLLEETWLARQAPGLREDARRSERYRLWQARETEAATAAAHVVTLGRAMADDLVARGVPAERVTTVPNGVDERLLGATTEPREARRALGLPEDGFWVGTVSSLVGYEGLDTLLDAVARLRAGGVDARALLVGDGVARASLEQRAAELGLGDAAVFTGRVPRERAALHHQALDVFAVPRQDTTVCRLVTPLKPVEAMALGRPVLASDLPALAEIVAEPGAGRLAPAGDVAAWANALAELAADDALRARLGEAGRRFAATRTWRRAGQTYAGLYARLVERA